MSLANALRQALDADFVVTRICHGRGVAIVLRWEWERARVRGANLPPEGLAEAEADLRGDLQPSDLAALTRGGLIPVPEVHAREMARFDHAPLPPTVLRALRVGAEDPNDE